MPWAQGVGRSNRPAPTNRIVQKRACTRYYSPALQRFISEDPIGLSGGDPNFYAYTFNSPTNLTDPSGESTIFGPLPSPYTNFPTGTLPDADRGHATIRKLHHPFLTGRTSVKRLNMIANGTNKKMSGLKVIFCR